MARLFPEEFTGLDEYCRQHDGFVDEGIRRADRDLQFYLAYLDYIRPLRAAGLRFCYPEVSAASKDVRAADTFDLALAHKLVARRRPVVTSFGEDLYWRLGGWLDEDKVKALRLCRYGTG